MRRRLAIVGAGGHAKVVADIVRCSSIDPDTGYEIVVFADAVASLAPRQFLGLPLLSGSRSLVSLPHDAVVVAVGDNTNRRKEFELLTSLGECLVSVQHPSAIIASSVTIGPGTMVCAGAVVNPDTRIGSNVILNTRSSVDHDCVIEDHVHIAPGVALGGNVYVGVGAMVGIGAVVKPGVRVGPGAMVGAGSVVIKDVPANTTVAGVPAKALTRSRQ